MHFRVKDDFQSWSDWAFRKKENLIFSKFWHGEILKILISDESIARCCMYGIELYILAQHGKMPYAQCKKEPSSGHTLEYAGEWVWSAKTSEGKKGCAGYVNL